MQTTYEMLPQTTRVWIYQSDHPFRAEDIPGLRQQVAAFANQWVSHNQQLKAFGDVYHRQFVVLMVDESRAGASGCSIDKSVHFIKSVEQQYGVNMFDRMRFCYKEGDEIRTAPRALFTELYQKGIINDNTLVFDNLVKNKGEFEKKWIVPLRKSWHKRMVS